ncbi:hypothetical protein L1987_63836 [Smallanthus sonchifolius]|uniref:Uncharacterized protein n=1 Tax=Smallanthus sonchifolius TaxID=185202 RepID=A0ACB9CEC3_9ASTR|nr:hypothetical protein L1987_63836 [Smallanthus sonchifolius]
MRRITQMSVVVMLAMQHLDLVLVLDRITRIPQNPSPTSSANQSAIAKIAEDYVALFSSCMLAYENFIGGKLTDPETIKEDLNQVDPDDMEDMDIQWNMAMILRRAKRFLNRTGRKFIGWHSNAKLVLTNPRSSATSVRTLETLLVNVRRTRHLPQDSQDQARETTKETIKGATTLSTAIKVKVGLMAEIMEMMEAKEREASIADQEDSTTAFALMATGEASCSSNESKPLRIAALSYKENEKRSKDSIETLKKEKRDYSLKISDRQFHLDVAYKGLEKRNNEINKLQNEILQLKGNIEKLKNSRFVVEHYESVVRQVNGLGMGTNAIPPPVSGKFVNGLIDIDLSCLDESLSQDDSSNKDDFSSKADSASDEEFLTASGDASENTCPEGVVYEELLGEQKVKKNNITDCDNLLYSQKPIITVHQTTFPVHHAESSNARSNEPYRRTYKEKRACFHCGMVGHIIVNCPNKNQGKRPVVSQPSAIPKSPPVKHPKSPKKNVVKPQVKPLVKPKTTSEAKPTVLRRENHPAKPCVSTACSAPTGEKPVVKLSKPQRRRRNKRLKKLEHLAGIQSGEASISSPAAVESKSTVPVKKKKRSWNKKSKSTQSPSPKPSKDSFIFDSHDCELIEGHPKGTIYNRWYVDSGCSRHMTGNMALLEDVKPFRGGYVAFAREKGELDSILWHRKLGHISYEKMNHLVRNGLVTSVPKLRFPVADDCMPCKKGKQQQKSHKPKLQNSIVTPLELLHMDLFGPISIKSIGGTKDETADILQYLILSLESLCKLKVRSIRSDNGTEFKNNLMELFCLKKEIRHEFSAPYTPQQNGVAERKNRTLIGTARTMLSDAKLPVTFWAEVVKIACHVLNKVLVVKRHN